MSEEKISWDKIRDRAVQRLYPDSEDLAELEEAYSEISGFINEQGLETFFAGSAGRGTCMKGDRDIDVFVLFPEDVERPELENRGLDIGRKVFKQFEGDYGVEYAEHPYTKGVIDGKEVEIVPCYDTDPEDIRSAVDRSPHHADWVDEHLTDTQREDVVLLKAFLRSAGIYGSSLKVQGFSGYLCEVLVYEFGGFKQLLESAQAWREREVIDPENYHEEGLDDKLESKFENDNLVVIDPVDPERNVASVLTAENYAKFIFQAWRFNREPGLNFFSEEEFELDRFKLKKEVESRADFVTLEFDKPDRPDDIIYPQVRKALRRITSVLEEEEFRVYETGFHVSEKVRLFFELDESLPETSYQRGPKLFHGVDHLEQFTEKYENTFVQDERIVAKTEREHTSARELVKEFFTGEASELEEKGIPGNLAEKAVNFRLVDILQDDEEWLKFLFNKLKVQ